MIRLAALLLWPLRVIRAAVELPGRVTSLEEQRRQAQAALARFIACRNCGCMYDVAHDRHPDPGTGLCAWCRRAVGRTPVAQA